MKMNTSVQPSHRSAFPPCATPFDCAQCNSELCLDAKRVMEAIHLMRLGARAVLASQVTGLDKTKTNRLYRQLYGVSSPPGQVPFMDSWHRRSDIRMLHTNIVWRLHQKLSRAERSKARTLIDLYEVYIQLVEKPVLDITRAAFVQHLTSLETWHERQCKSCETNYATPVESNSTVCPGCLIYHRLRCHQCGCTLSPRSKGRGHANCRECGAVLIGGVRH